MREIDVINLKMTRKNFEQCPTDIFVSTVKRKSIHIVKNVWETTSIPGFGQGPRKKLSYKLRMVKKIQKEIIKAKKMGFKKNKMVCIAIDRNLYNCKIIYITEIGKIQIKYENGHNEIYSCKDLNRMRNNGKYINEIIKEREERMKYIKYKSYLMYNYR